jgi:DNA replication licensing factor MCM6
VLAAANPIGGRYDRSKSLRANLNLSAPIMSRFDLFFVIVDECNPDADRRIASHIFACHTGKDSPVGGDVFSGEQLRRYIRFAKKLEPKITDESLKVLVESYCDLRQEDAVGTSRASYRITVRQLEALVRLSEALAKLHLDKEVRPEYVREATRLLKRSIIQVEAEAITLDLPEIEIDDGQAQTVRDVSYDEYSRIGKNLIMHLQQLERAEGKPPTIDELTDWWMKENTEKYTDMEEVARDAETVRLICTRLVRVDQVLVLNEEDQTLTIHPNYTDD